MPTGRGCLNGGMRLTRSFAVLLLVVVAVTGCRPGADRAAPTPSASGRSTSSATAIPRPTPTSTPAPVPTKPAVADLVLTPDGLGPLVLGAVPPTTDPALDILVLDPAHCDAAYGDPGLWIANYTGDAPFTVGVSEGGEIFRIDTWMGPIPTDTGLTVGSPLSAVLAAYPGGFDNIITSGGLSDVYVVDGTHGRLLIEVAKDGDLPGYWPPGEVDTVRYLLAIGLAGSGGPIAASDNVVGVCTGGM
ncbi:MAG: hypothetical protein JWP85_2519 [Rhodoglobus sp.]|nr:hypothetical protein [Rhodoglobus sp.]